MISSLAWRLAILLMLARPGCPTPPCSASLTTNCAIGFNVYNTTAGQRIKMNNSPIPVDITPGAVALTYLSPSFGIGETSANATCLFNDSAGVQRESQASMPGAFLVEVSPPTFTTDPIIQ